MKEGFCSVRINIESPQDAIDRHNNTIGRFETTRKAIVKVRQKVKDESRSQMLEWIERDNIRNAAKESRATPRRKVKLEVGSKVRIPLPSISLR